MTDAADAEPDSISVFGLEDTEDRSLFKRSDEFRYARAKIPTADLAKHVSDFFISMKEVIDSAPQETDRFRLDQVQLTVEISAKGQVSLLGTGGELAGKGGLSFTFKRQAPKDS